MRRKSFLSNPTRKIIFAKIGRRGARNTNLFNRGWTRIGGAHHSVRAACHLSPDKNERTHVHCYINKQERDSSSFAGFDHILKTSGTDSTQKE
jgi:hypothetical protein